MSKGNKIAEELRTRIQRSAPSSPSRDQDQPPSPTSTLSGQYTLRSQSRDQELQLGRSRTLVRQRSSGSQSRDQDQHSGSSSTLDGWESFRRRWLEQDQQSDGSGTLTRRRSTGSQSREQGQHSGRSRTLSRLRSFRSQLRHHVPQPGRSRTLTRLRSFGSRLRDETNRSSTLTRLRSFGSRLREETDRSSTLATLRNFGSRLTGHTQDNNEVTMFIYTTNDKPPLLISNVRSSDKGKRLFYEVIRRHHPVLEERMAKYFRLYYELADEDAIVWLDLEKPIEKQMYRARHKYTFYWKPKYYPTNPHLLPEAAVRERLYREICEDIAEGTLPCPQNNLATQEELNDLNSSYTDRRAMIKECLEKAQNLDFYGIVHILPTICKDTKNWATVCLGVGSKGILAFNEKTKHRLQQFLWEGDYKICQRKNEIVVEWRGRGLPEKTRYLMHSERDAKQFFKWCKEFGDFFKKEKKQNVNKKEAKKLKKREQLAQVHKQAVQKSQLRKESQSGPLDYSWDSQESWDTVVSSPAKADYSWDSQESWDSVVTSQASETSVDQPSTSRSHSSRAYTRKY